MSHFPANLPENRFFVSLSMGGESDLFLSF